MENDTIAAIATPPGISGIGIIRISGPLSVDIAARIFSRQRDSVKGLGAADEAGSYKSHRLYYGNIKAPGQNGMVDEVLLAVMRAPKSYTREDVVEIQSHSGSVILNTILRLVIENGARLAEPGEFTKRAFLNGRIDLSQAESIAEMISAKTESGLKLAATHLEGRLKAVVTDIVERLTRIQVELEAGIEFGEDIEQDIDYEQFSVELQDMALKNIENMIRHYIEGHVLRDGIRLAIVGRPNVGKSSLLNRLLSKDRAIVTPLPGTTRDVIEELVNIEGVPISVADTAGLHLSQDPVEIIGIQKTKENIQQADLVLWVLDAAIGFTPDDQSVYDQIESRRILMVMNKADLLATGQKIAVPTACRNEKSVYISAKFGTGMDLLRSTIKSMCLNEVEVEPGRTIVPSLRQKTALESAREAIKGAVEGLGARGNDELIVSDLIAAKNALGLITGDHIGVDILDDIFSRFCIGK